MSASASLPTARTRVSRAAYGSRVASTASGSTGRTTGSTGPSGMARPAPACAMQPQKRALERGPQAFALRDGGLQPSTERRDLPLVRLAQRDRLPLGLCEARPRLLLVRARLREAAPQPLALGEQVIRRGLQPLDLRLSLPALAFELTHGGLGAGERGPRAVGVSAGRGLRFFRR